MTPNRFSNALCTSTGRLAPPATATRRLAASCLTSTSLSSSAPSSPQYIVGTPAKKVTSSFAISDSAGPASNRGSITTVPP